MFIYTVFLTGFFILYLSCGHGYHRSSTVDYAALQM